MRDYDKNTATVDHYPGDGDDPPVNPKRFCFQHGFDSCDGEAIDCDVIEEKEAA